MRPAIVIKVILVGCFLLGMLVFARKQGAKKNVVSTSTQANFEQTEIAAQTKQALKSQTRPQLPEGDQQPSESQHRMYVDSRVNELMDLGMMDDPDSLATILSELTNRDPEIRKAALDASIQFGSRDAIPKLMEAVSQTDDPKEKAEIVDAIELLKLPSATEVLAQARTMKKTGQPGVKGSTAGRSVFAPR